MKSKILFIAIVAVCLSISVAFAQTTGTCTAKSASEKSACCMKGMTKASDAKCPATAHSTVMQTKYTDGDEKTAHCATMSAKECATMSAKECAKMSAAECAKHASQCTAAEKAQCSTMKTTMTKECAKACSKAKATEAKADVKKGSTDKSVASKGTN